MGKYYNGHKNVVVESVDHAEHHAHIGYIIMHTSIV